MREYIDQPIDHSAAIDPKRIEDLIFGILMEDLPACTINVWFMQRTYGADMVSKIASEIKEEFGI